MSLLKNAYLRLVYPRPRLHKALMPTAIFAKFFIDHIKSLPRQLLTVDIIRLMICLPRYVVFYLILRRRKFAADIESGVSRSTIEHNMRGTGELAAPRSHTLIRPIVSIASVSRNLPSMKVLTIGPRVEGEIYNLIGYGFSGKNITALDLFSYSPYIQVGNMHHMEFPDDYFDVVISGWVLGYSDTKQACANEMLRVTKPGGVIAIGNAYSAKRPEETVLMVGNAIGSEELITDLSSVEKLFNVQPEDIYFRYDGSRDRIEGSPMISIFRKSA